MSTTIKMCDSFRSWLGKTNVPVTCIRNISSSNSQLKNYASREARFMRKIMGNKNSGRKQWYQPHETIQALPAQISPFPKSASKNGQNQRRVAVLNKLFMRHISEMMASGGLTKEIVGRGLEISRVKTAPDFNRINVFWLAKGTEDDAEIEKILTNYSWELRHELSQLRVVGIVPPIYFIKDKEYAKIVEVNRILAKADFGEDYAPIDVGYRLKSEFAQTSHLPAEIKAKVEELEGTELEIEADHPLLPPMRNDVLGLQHAEIMFKIKKGIKKSKALHRQIYSHSTSMEDSNEINEPVMNTSIDSQDDSLQNVNINPKKEDFAKFLMKRRFQKKKMLGQKKNYTPEMELYETEVLENSKLATDLMENIDNEKDFIDDIEDKFRN